VAVKDTVVVERAATIGDTRSILSAAAKKHVLYLSYNGLAEPLGRRQVVPYIVGLARRGHSYTVVSFEKTRDRTQLAAVRAAFAGLAVDWVPLRYHKWPSVPATAYDCLRGIIAGLRATRTGVDLVHARSAVPALMAWTIAGWRDVPWIYDVRGLMAREYADAARWPSDGWLFRLTSMVEAGLLARAHGLVFLTERIRRELGASACFRADRPTAVIPCCVDLEVFGPSSRARLRSRRELGMGEEPLLVYSGSLGSWYLIDEMMAFFAVARREIPELRFLLVTPQVDRAVRAARRAGVDQAVLVRKAAPDEVPALLAAADAGICFLKDCRSKNASSPTKYAEYLACGLPVITNPWTGDARELSSEPAWILVDGLTAGHYQRGAERLRSTLREGARQSSARGLAERELALPQALDRYEDLYVRVGRMTA
jgi:glycosyltransferase involved in cell wall biosynthesis